MTSPMIAAAAERLLNDLGFAAPEMFSLHIKRRMEEVVEEALAAEWQWLESTRRLQTETFGYDYSAMTTADKARYLFWNAFAAHQELAEAAVEWSWAPWAIDEPFVNRDRIRDELIDVLHFVGNMLTCLGVTDDELSEHYRVKQEKNRRRAASGAYSKKKGSLGEGSETE